MSDHAATLLSDLKGLLSDICDCEDEIQRITNGLRETLAKELTDDVKLLPDMAGDLLSELAYHPRVTGWVGTRLSEARMRMEDWVIYPLEQAMKEGEE